MMIEFVMCGSFSKLPIELVRATLILFLQQAAPDELLARMKKKKMCSHLFFF